MATQEIKHIDGHEAFGKALTVSRETLGRFETYAALLKRWQKTINLVAPSTLDDIWHRHFADSAQLWDIGRTSPSPREGRGEGRGEGQPLAPEPVAAPHPDPLPIPRAGEWGEGTQHWTDFGSGAGFPGLVLAILGAETGATRHTLIESDSRKAAFLREVARETGVAVDILCARIESPETVAKVGRVDCVTARALAPLSRLVPLLAPYFASPTVGLFLKGREVAAEIEETARTWEFASRSVASVTDKSGSILVVHALRQKR